MISSEYMNYHEAWSYGRDLGREEGISIGESIGESKGMARGIEQRNNQIISNLLNKNASIEYISEITNLPISEIKKIKRM